MARVGAATVRGTRVGQTWVGGTSADKVLVGMVLMGLVLVGLVLTRPRLVGLGLEGTVLEWLFAGGARVGVGGMLAKEVLARLLSVGMVLVGLGLGWEVC